MWSGGLVLVVMMVQERPNKEEGGSTGSEWDEKVTKRSTEEQQ